MNTVAQLAIMILGSSAIWFVGRKESWKRWGYIIGMCGQPFWIYTAIYYHQWGILAMTIFYTYSWGQGIWNYWIKKPTLINNPLEEEIEIDHLFTINDMCRCFEQSRLTHPMAGFKHDTFEDYLNSMQPIDSP